MKLTKRNAVQFLLYLLLTAGLVIVVMPFLLHDKHLTEAQWGAL
ncbi:hypothetical protein [Eisenbergiella tayi]|nr:hypothetical protein [Eisenbergiella tayi]